MNFILICKKQNFLNEQINDDLLHSTSAPSLVSKEAFKFENGKFVLYVYPYDQIDKEVYGYSYYADEDKILLINGILNVNNDLRNPDICKFFNELKDSDDLLGDYQLISLDKKGNGFIKTPPLSIRQLFYYEDENSVVLSTEIKLIVDGVEKFREKNFVNHFDPDFIYDSVFRTWTPRDFPQKTVFKEIKRLLPYETKYFKEGEIHLEKNDIKIPQWFRDTYNEDRTKLYDDYFKTLMSFAEKNLANLKPNIEKITCGLTGGLDSRITACILSRVCKKIDIEFTCSTGGTDSNPDVIIAKKVAKVLGIKHNHVIPSDNIYPNTKEYKDYTTTFYISQGDFNSNNFISSYDRHLVNPKILHQLGMDAFKRISIFKLYTANRWFARRILSYRNFYFPLFFTEYETWFALLYAEEGEDVFKEFVYEIIKRIEPKLLDVPFVGDSLPQVNVEPYLKRSDIIHDKEPLLWDYNYIRMNLKPIFNKRFNEMLGIKGRLFLYLIGLNEFDYFFNRKLNEIIQSYKEKQISLKKCLKILYDESKVKRYPKTKSLVKMTKENRYPFIARMQILMDFASVAEKTSFEEIEIELGLHMA